MEIEDRINAIKVELQQTKDDLKEILADIRKHLSETPGAIPDKKPTKPRGKGGKTKWTLKNNSRISRKN